MSRGFSNTCSALLALIFIAATCEGPIHFQFGTASVGTPLYIVNNPLFIDGDPVAGRRAFIDLKCIDCHRVAEDPHLPRGPRAMAGPLLHDLDRYSPSELGKIIFSTKTGENEELYGRRMKDYTEKMHVRQLVDVVAYLRHPRQPNS